MRKYQVLVKRNHRWYVFYVWADSQIAAAKTAKIHYYTGVTVD